MTILAQVTKKRNTNHKSKESDLITVYIFTKSFAVWKRYNGDVPESELDILDCAGDWPKGVARAAIERLTRDRQFREGVEEAIEKGLL